MKGAQIFALIGLSLLVMSVWELVQRSYETGALGALVALAFLVLAYTRWRAFR